MKKTLSIALCGLLGAATLIAADDAKASVKAAAKKLGAKVTDIYWTLGEYDGLLIFQAADDETATALLLHLAAAGNVHTTTARAFTASEMDKILTNVHVS